MIKGLVQWKRSQIARFIGPTWGPPGSCRSQMGPMLATWTLLSGSILSVKKNSQFGWNKRTYNTLIYKSMLWKTDRDYIFISALLPRWRLVCGRHKNSSRDNNTASTSKTTSWRFDAMITLLSRYACKVETSAYGNSHYVLFPLLGAIIPPTLCTDTHILLIFAKG